MSFMPRSRHFFFDSLAFSSGLLLVFAFAPFYLFWLAPIALALLLYSWKNATPIRASVRGLLFGIGFFGLGVYWVYISIHYFGGTNIPLSLFFTSLLIITLALFPTIQLFLLSAFFPKHHLKTLLLAFPSSWVILEWIRGWLFTGFPWLYLGYSQTSSPLRGYAPLFGVYGLSFIVALFGAGLFTVFLSKTEKIKWLLLAGLIGIVITGGVCTHIKWTNPLKEKIKVSLIQGNIPQQLKWTPKQIQPTLNLYKKMTIKHLNSDVIIWPEAAIPFPLHEAQHYLSSLSHLAKKNHTTIILGIPTLDKDKFKYYNSAIAIGEGKGLYHKQRLVIFGEYIPFEKWLRGLIAFFDLPMSDFISGKKDQPLLTANHINISTSICYEVAYSNIIRRDMPTANILIAMSNDAWFGDSFALEQHLQIAQMRSLETGRPFLFSTNNGITAVIGADGRTIQSIPKFKTDVLTTSILPRKGATPWIKFGNTPTIIIMLGLFFFALRKYKPKS